MNALKDVYRHVSQGTLARAKVRRRNPGARIALTVRIVGDPAAIRLADGVTLDGPSTLAVADGGGLTGSRLSIGERTYVGEFANIRCGGAPVRIGRDVMIAQHVSLVATGHGIEPGIPIGQQAWHGDGIEIGDGAWIGAGATVLPGVRIGADAIVGAGSVVTRDVPDHAVVAGVPAALIRDRSPQPPTPRTKDDA